LPPFDYLLEGVDKMKRYPLVLSILALAIFAVSISKVSADIGTGQLFVYTDPARTTLAPNDGNTFDVVIGFTYYYRIWGITEFNTGDKLTIKIAWKDAWDVDHTDFIPDVEVLESGVTKYVDFTWTVPLTAKICTTGTVHYRMLPPPAGSEYLAKGVTRPVAHLHYIPETHLGTLGPMLALLTGLVAFPLFRKRLIKPLIT